MQMLISESHFNVPAGSMISRSGARGIASVRAERTSRWVDGSRRWASLFGWLSRKTRICPGMLASSLGLHHPGILSLKVATFKGGRSPFRG